MERTKDTSFDTWLGRARTIIWIMLGVGIAAHQTLLASEPNPLLIGLAGLCLGLPITTRIEKD